MIIDVMQNKTSNKTLTKTWVVQEKSLVGLNRLTHKFSSWLISHKNIGILAIFHINDMALKETNHKWGKLVIFLIKLT